MPKSTGGGFGSPLEAVPNGAGLLGSLVLVCGAGSDWGTVATFC